MDENKMLSTEETELANPTAEPITESEPTPELEEASAATDVIASDRSETKASEVGNASVPEVAPAEQATEKKPISKKLLYAIGAGVTVAIIAFIIIFLTVIQPNQIYEVALAAFERSDFYACEQLIKKIPNHKKVPELEKDLTLAVAESYIEEGELDMAENMLVTLHGDEEAKELRQDIQYLRAAALIEQGNIDDAKMLLDKIPDHDDPKQLREHISYESALAALETGDYKTAYELFSQLGNFQDAAQQKDTVYYEALAFKSLFNIQPTLKNPASLRVTKVTFYTDSSNVNELDAIYEITATNSYGGSLGAYVYDLTLYDEDDDSGMITHSAYVDPDDYIELLNQMLVDAVKEQSVFKTTVDVARMNRLLEGNASFNIDLPFKAADVVES